MHACVQAPSDSGVWGLHQGGGEGHHPGQRHKKGSNHAPPARSPGGRLHRRHDLGPAGGGGVLIDDIYRVPHLRQLCLHVWVDGWMQGQRRRCEAGGREGPGAGALPPPRSRILPTPANRPHSLPSIPPGPVPPAAPYSSIHAPCAAPRCGPPPPEWTPPPRPAGGRRCRARRSPAAPPGGLRFCFFLSRENRVGNFKGGVGMGRT